MENKNINLRLAVLDSLLEYEKTGKKLDEIMHETLVRFKELPRNQRSFYVRLLQGCIEQKIRLDYYIGSYSSVPIKKIKPVIKNILRLSMYQIFFMNNVSDSTIVNEAVKLAAAKKFTGLKGFVNGVLRNTIREREKIKLPDRKDPLLFLSVTYSMPEYLARKWIDEYGLDEAEKICSALLKVKPLSIHIKDTDNDENETVKSLVSEGVKVEKAPYPKGAYFLSETGALTDLSAFKEGRFFVQDISSQTAAACAGIKGGEHILDMCAAPGGKSLFMADALNGTGSVLSRDVSNDKTALIEENISRLKLKNMTTECFDGTVFDENSVGKYDIVFVDAPCSGYGVIGKKADIKYGASKEKEEALIKIQRKILDNAAKYVKCGGTLIYSTCTINRGENEENAIWFVNEHKGFLFDSLKRRIPKKFEADLKEETEFSTCQLMPSRIQDGFFIARFVNGLKVDVQK